jgi:hypothetical protein
MKAVLCVQIWPDLLLLLFGLAESDSVSRTGLDFLDLKICGVRVPYVPVLFMFLLL